MIVSTLNLRVAAGKASPSPAIASSLGPKGVNLMQFCKACNDATTSFNTGEQVRVKISIFKDKTFKITVRGPSSTDVIREVLKIKKFSSSPGKELAKSISSQELESITSKLCKYLNTRDMKSASLTVIGKLKSMGVAVS